MVFTPKFGKLILKRKRSVDDVKSKKVLSGGNRQTGDLDEVTDKHSMTNSLTPYCFLYLNTNA